MKKLRLVRTDGVKNSNKVRCISFKNKKKKKPRKYRASGVVFDKKTIEKQLRGERVEGYLA